MSDVRKWLEAINLSQYADAFETNDIEIDLLEQVMIRRSKTSE